MSRRSEGRRVERAPATSRTPLLVVVGVLALLAAVATGALAQVVVHAVAWPALTGGWVAERLGFETGSGAHTLARWVGQLPWTLVLLAAVASVARQWWAERAQAVAHRTFRAAHGAELAELQARVDGAPGMIDAIEAEVARTAAAAQALGSDAWAAGAVVSRLPVRLVVERPENAFSLHAVEDGEVSVRATDLTFVGAGAAGDVQVWDHTMLKLYREPTRLLLGHTGRTRRDGVPAGVEAIEAVLDHLEVLLELARGEIDLFTARQRLVRLVQVGNSEIDRILDRGEADLTRIAEIEAIRPGASDSDASGAFASTVWGAGAQRSTRALLPTLTALLKPRELVEFVVRVRSERGGPDLVMTTDRRVLAVVRSSVAEDGPVVSLGREQVTEVALGERTRAVTLRLADGRAVPVGRLRSATDEIPTLFHLRPTERFTAPVAVPVVAPALDAEVSA